MSQCPPSAANSRGRATRGLGGLGIRTQGRICRHKSRSSSSSSSHWHLKNLLFTCQMPRFS